MTTSPTASCVREQADRSCILDIVGAGKQDGRVGKGKGDKGKKGKARPEHRRAVDASAREEQVTGIRPARLSALATLSADGPTTLGGLARRERVTPPSMTRLVQALEADGLVERVPSATDGREVGVRITPAGERLLAERGLARADAVAGWLRPLDDDQLRVVDTAVTLLEGSLRDAR
jgi:DNA-binding MarR family transcriptional regulator